METFVNMHKSICQGKYNRGMKNLKLLKKIASLMGMPELALLLTS